MNFNPFRIGGLIHHPRDEGLRQDGGNANRSGPAVPDLAPSRMPAPATPGKASLLQKLYRRDRQPSTEYADKLADDLDHKIRHLFSSATRNGALSFEQAQQMLGRVEQDAHREIDKRFDKELAAVRKMGKLSNRPAQLEVDRAHAHQRISNFMCEARKMTQYLPYRLTQQALGKGVYGSVGVVTDEKGNRFAGKILNPSTSTENNDPESLDHEYAAFKKIRLGELEKKLKPHPNVLRAHGITMVPVGGVWTRMLITDYIPGIDGHATFNALRRAWDEGKITSAQYWSAVQFLTRRLLSAVKHLAAVGVIHNDIKTSNFVVNEETGEPVLIDPGLWSAKGTAAKLASRQYAAPEAVMGLPVDERGGVYGIGTGVMHGVEGARRPLAWDPWARKMDYLAGSEGLYRGEVLQRDSQGNLKKVQTNKANTNYTEFIDALTEKRTYLRPNTEEASELPFVADSILDDEASREVIRTVLGFEKARKNAQAAVLSHVPSQQKTASELEWEQTLARNAMQASFASLRAVPALSGLAKLYRESAHNPMLRAHLDHGSLVEIHPIIEQEALQKANPLLTAVMRDFPDLPAIADRIPAVKIGVNAEGMTPEALQDAAQAARSKLPADSLARLRAFRQEAERLLADVSEIPLQDENLAAVLENLRARAAAATNVLDLLERHPAPEAVDVNRRVEAFEELYKDVVPVIQEKRKRSTEVFQKLYKKPFKSR